MKKAIIILIAALAVLPSILSAGVSQSVLTEIASEMNATFRATDVPHSAMNISLTNADNGKTIVFYYAGKLIDAAIKNGTRSVEQLRDNTFAGITSEEIRYYKAAGYTRAKVIACGKVSYYYFR